MKKYTLSPKEIDEIERQKTLDLILNRITHWDKSDKVDPKMLAEFLCEMFFENLTKK
jgi:hypothetical protein